MDETLQRLKDTAAACIKAYEVWGESKKNAEAREAMQEAVHELRKVAARLEIEMAASERDETNQRQIPIPPHRASRVRQGPADNIGNELPDFIREGGNQGDSESENDVNGNGGNDQRPQQNHRPRMQGGGGRRPFGGQNRRPQGAPQSE